MPEYRHPRTLDGVDGHPPAAVTVSGTNHDVTDGTFACDDERGVERLADAYGVAVSDLRVGGESNQQSGDDGESLVKKIEGGECPWCDEYTGDGVPQHASSAHPDEWSAYKEDAE